MAFWGVLVIAALTVTAQARPAAVYSDAVDRYVADDFSDAAALLGGLQRRDVQKEADTLVRAAADGEAARRRLEAAAMLHTQYAMLDDLDNLTTAFHIDMAHLLLSVDRSRAGRRRPAAGPGSSSDIADLERSRAFLPRWYALSSSILLLHGLERNARALVDEGVKLFPEDPAMVFREALVTEFRAVWSPPAPADPHPELGLAMSDADATLFDLSYGQRLWEPAASAYRRVLALDPDNAEARLHLGFALSAQGKFADAASELEAARSRAADPYVVCLAHLFLGRVRERQGNVDGAAQEYERALAAQPLAQSAYMALSLLEQRRGNPQRARELVDQFVRIPPRERADDPWWGYHVSRLPVEDLHWLRIRVRG